MKKHHKLDDNGQARASGSFVYQRKTVHRSFKSDGSKPDEDSLSRYPLIITKIILTVGGVILLEAALSFIGIGDANHISWGYMLHNGQHFIRDAWWIIAFI